MKKITIITLAFITFVSCGDSKQASFEDLIEQGNLSALKEKRQALSERYDALQADLRKIDQAISDLDTIQNLPLITTLTARDTVFNHFIELQGNVNTRKNIVINAEYSGMIERVLVDEGEAVKAGELLAEIDDGGLSAQLAQMRVQADLARTTFERQKNLWEQNIGSEMQYLQAKSQYESMQNSLDQLESQLSKTRVTAPFAGTIDEVISEEGSNVGPGTPMFRLVNLDDMHINIEVPETYIPDIQKGTEVKAFFPVLNKEIETQVKQASNYINPENRSFKVEVAVPKEGDNIKPNLTARVKLNDYTNQNAILIPQSIIIENAAGEQFVYLAGEVDEKGEAVVKRTVIETGKTQGDLVEVVKGIEPGDRVVEEGARNVREGQRVKILNR
ncbi:efflux RND transporter periplasmic adaptor subunit [Robertkochia aurantiaca]|uniref:efflux RND transporter periplasmic adaptor subunit n=1 Tax=Robertkochia aurantiaca TaxID=2873700 RepID=UPI001CCDBB04|nr:efflux RND transporter periplasmic adaptor subunit [Robertkochia sp. 3YJGBD-33]